MDLRAFKLNPDQVEKGFELLQYQPFLLSDDVQTGVGYSWIYCQEAGYWAGPNDMKMKREETPEEVWTHFCDANAKLRAMYDDWIDTMSITFKKGSVMEVGCNTGYFLMGLALKGFGPCNGYDFQNFGPSFDFLNQLLGTQVSFHQEPYDLVSRSIRSCQQHDFVISSAVMQHISDPMGYLTFLSRAAKKGLFLFTGMGDTDDFLIYQGKPNAYNKDAEFPFCFDLDVGLSRGLLFFALRKLGFKHILELHHKDSWLPKSWYGSQRALICIK